MSNLSQFENLISEELTAESQATIAGGSFNFYGDINGGAYADDITTTISYEENKLNVKFDDLTAVVADDKNFIFADS